MTQVSNRIQSIVESNAVLSLHLVDDKQLVKQAAQSQETLKTILANHSLQQKLRLTLAYQRVVTGINWHPIESVGHSDISFCKWPKTDPIQYKVRQLLDLARNLSGNPPLLRVGVQLMTLVLADSDEDAFSFHHALVTAEMDSDICFAAVNREQELKWRRKTERFFVCVSSLSALSVNFPLTNMSDIVSFRQLCDVHDFLELDSFCPEQTVHFLSINQSQVEAVSKVLRFMKPYTEAMPGPARQLQVSRSFYKSRSRYNASPVHPIFN
jgi:hypothetical protein